MKHRLVFSFKYNEQTGKYVMIDPPASEEELLAADMVEELFLPSWQPRPKPKTITIILNFDMCEDNNA